MNLQEHTEAWNELEQGTAKGTPAMVTMAFCLSIKEAYDKGWLSKHNALEVVGRAGDFTGRMLAGHDLGDDGCDPLLNGGAHG